jgi:hypothetical protein
MTNILTPAFGIKKVNKVLTENIKDSFVKKPINEVKVFRSSEFIYFPSLNCYLRPNTPI